MIRGLMLAVALCALSGASALADPQADTMRAKFAKGDRSPPSGYEIQGPTFYRINQTEKGRGAWLPNSRPAGDAKTFWDRTDREGAGSNGANQ